MNTADFAAQFAERVDTAGECWLWTGTIDKHGYGVFGIRPNGTLKKVGAHRFAWLMYFGEIPEGILVCHSCDVRHCVNPAHLWLGSPEDNSRDMVAKGRSSACSLAGCNNPNVRLTEDQVMGIRRDYASGKLSQVALADKYQIGQTTVHKIVHRILWKHLHDQMVVEVHP